MSGVGVRVRVTYDGTRALVTVASGWTMNQFAQSVKEKLVIPAGATVRAQFLLVTAARPLSKPLVCPPDFPACSGQVYRLRWWI